MAEAVATGDFDALGQLTELARSLGGAIAAAASMQHSRPAPVTRQPPSARRASAPSKGSVRAKTSKNKYPRFFRDGEMLVKVAWSKSNKDEYEHRSPRAVVLAVASALQAVARSKDIFAVEDVIPINNPADSNDVPSYQVYLCVAWMRARGLLTQHGRQGYSLPVGQSLREAVERDWLALESSR
jgi:hypothetical protein